MKALAVLSTIALLVGARPGCAADLFRVAGVVVNAETGKPLPRALLALTKTEGSTVVERQMAGEDGRFSLDLPQGKYNLFGGTRADFQLYGRRAPDSGVGTSIITGPDQDTASLIFRWFPTGGISGKIVDESGEPVEDALVQLVRSNITAGQRATRTYGWTRTDDRGEYRFGRLLATTYYLTVTGRPWYGTSPTVGEGSGATSMAYRTVYYPDSLDRASAAPLVLKPGEERRADFILHAVMGANLKLTYENPQGLSGRVGLITEGIGGSDGYERQEQLMPYGQTLAGVCPGRYTLRVVAMRDKVPLMFSQTIDVAGGDIEVKVAPVAPPEVSGTVEMKTGSAKPRGTVIVSLVRPDNTGVTATAVQADGKFSMPPVLPGKYRPILRGADSLVAADIRVEGADFRDSHMDLIAGRSVVLQIIASDETGRVGGFVVREGRPMEGMLVVLAPKVENTANPALGFQTDSDGSFDYQNVPAGDYYLFAVEDGRLEYTNRQIIGPYLESATLVHVEAHGLHSQRISVATPPGK